MTEIMYHVLLIGIMKSMTTAGNIALVSSSLDVKHYGDKTGCLPVKM